MTHTKTSVLQYSDYYAFGLSTENSWARDNGNNNFLYNEGSELNKTSGFYDLPFRNYDAALGRFFQVDPMAAADHSISPFAYANNNLWSDLWGVLYTPEGIHNIEVTTAIVLFSLFLNKDVFFGKSIGKFLVGLRVVSSKTGNPASPIQCMIRNLFVLIWPIEALMLVFSPKRRIGDFVAGTRVDERTEIYRETKRRSLQVILSVVGAFILVYSLFNFVDGLGVMN